MTIQAKRKGIEHYDYTRIDHQIRILDGIYNAFKEDDYAEAGIRISHAGFLPLFPSLLSTGGNLQKDFNPSEPRDARGRWVRSWDGRSTKPTSHTVVVDPFCKIVKQLCIVEATETLATRNNGMSFFNALNACMDRHGCLGRA